MSDPVQANEIANRSKEQVLEQRVRDSAPLLERLADIRKRVGHMCANHRGPKMTIPVAWYDDDFFISTTVKDAIAALSAPHEPKEYPERAVSVLKARSHDRATEETGEDRPAALISPLGATDWQDACRLFRARCNSTDCTNMAHLRTYIETGELIVVRPLSETKAPQTKEEVAVSIQCRKCLTIARCDALKNVHGWYFTTITGWICPKCQSANTLSSPSKSENG